jgi:tRNA G18 (ribose-2'-O)-methylase SpoU
MSQHPLIIILEDIRSALNVGAIFRTADGAGASQLFLVGITPYPPHNRIPKTALGAIDYVAWQHFTSISEAINNLPAGYEIVGAE